MLTNPLIKLRQSLFSRPVMHALSKRIPKMSETERIALEAGNVWWDGQLFTGKPDWDYWLSQPPAQLTQLERDYIDNQVQQLCKRLNDWEITHKMHDLPPEIWQEIRDSGLFGMIIPKKYGGLGFSAYAHSQVVMKLASRSITAAVTVMVPNSLGPAKLLLHYGTDSQKDYYLPRLAKGIDIPCFALTNPHAGSDAASIPDLGIVEYGNFNGQQILGIRLNWQKRYITLGPVATLLGIAFQLQDPQEYLGKGTNPGITLALIPRETPGVTIGKRHIPMSIPFQNGPNQGKDVFIPIDWVIGGNAGIGNGWRMLMECLSEGRSISLPALATGAAKTACRYTGAYARIRQQFHLPIGQFEGIRQVLGRMVGLTYKMDAARHVTLAALDNGEHPSVISAILKYHLTENYRQIVNDAMDIQGGSGICLGKNNLLGRIYQAIPIAITVEGANILTRSMIIFGQGSVRCHPYLLKQLHAIATDDLVAFDQAISAHVGYFVKNLFASLWMSLSKGRFSKAPKHSKVKAHYRKLNQMSRRFSFLADVFLLSLGAHIKRKENLSARLGDILSELYLMSASLKHFHDAGEPAEDRPVIDWVIQQGLYECEQNMQALLRNHPNRLLSWLTRWFVLPFGQATTPPSDKLTYQIAERLLKAGDARDRLTHGIYINKESKDKVGLLEIALFQSEKTERLDKRIHAAVKQHRLHPEFQQPLIQQALNQHLINQQEYEQLRFMQQLTDAVIHVDSFRHYGKADWHKQTHTPFNNKQTEEES